MILESIWHGRLGGLRLVMLLAVGALILIGLVTIKSTGRTSEFNKQAMWIILGIGCFILINLVHYHYLGHISFLLYLVSLILLVVVLVGKHYELTAIVPKINGSTRWVKLLPLESDSPIVSAARIQPSELTKLAYLLALAWYLRYRRNYRTLRGLLPPLFLSLLPMGLIILEPDLGTGLLFLPVLFAVLFAAGAKVRHFLLIMLLGLMCAPLFYQIMEPYQRNRILAIYHHDSDKPKWIELNRQYNNAKYYIVLGGALGHGEEETSFVRNKSVPEEHNDFIFARIAYHWGFLGGAGVLFMYGLILLGGLEIASQHNDPFGRLIAVGITAMLATQMFINIGVTLGLMPVTGMNLPFVSYGGSSLLTNFLALGLLINVARHRPWLMLGRKPFEFDDEEEEDETEPAIYMRK